MSAPGDGRAVCAERTPDGAFTITLARPPLNILSIAALHEIDAAIHAAREERGARAVVFRHEGKFFSAGADVAEHLPEKVGAMLAAFHRVFRALYDLPLPTLALVDGPALGGGCELAAFCDIVIAGANARFGQPEIRLAALAPVATAILPRIVGPREAQRLLLTGATIEAEEARRLGLVTEVVPGGTLDAALAAWLDRMGGTSGAVLGIAARAARRAAFPDFLDELHRLEHVYVGEVARHPDATEGLRAFLEKRAPRWSGS
jgi:cyclohexa-1,5-dienecarbonyl-CoA hydratase